MFKRVYQFAFAFVFLLTCSFFVSDNVFAATYSHEGNISIVKPSADNVGDYWYNKYINVLNYYHENLESQYPYYFFYYNSASQISFYVLQGVSLNTTASNIGVASNPFISFYVSSSSYSSVSSSDYSISSTSSGNFGTKYSLPSCSFSSSKFNCTADVILDTNLSLPFKSSRWGDVKLTDIFINNVRYTNGLMVDLTPLSSEIELNTKINGSISNQLNSIDVYLDSTVENDGEYNFSLAIQDLYDYTNSNASYGDISGFSFKGLVNDNGLYHWETITNNNDFYVDYDDDDWTNNSSESCLNTENSSSGCTGYSFKGTAYYDMTGYDQIKFSIDVYNTREYFIKYDDDYDSVSSDYIDLNYYFLGDETGQRYGRTFSKGYRYMFFSAYGDLVNTELNNYYVIIRSNHYNQYNDVPIFFNKFNNSSYYFLDYDDNNVYTLKKLNNYTYLRYAFEIGETSATGFYTDLNADDIFTYEVYIPDNLYFSYTNDVTESTFINSSGEVVDDGIFPDTNISITNINSYSNIFESALHYFTEPIRFIFLYFGDFFDTLPIALKYTFISTFTLSIVIIVIKFVI